MNQTERSEHHKTHERKCKTFSELIYYFMPRKFVRLFLVGYQIVNATF